MILQGQILKLGVKIAISRDSSIVESGFDRVSGSRLVASMDLCWYGTVQRSGGNLLVLGIGAV